MANNIIVKDANSSNVTMKTTEIDGVHTASSIPEGEVLEILQSIRNTLNRISSATTNLQLYPSLVAVNGAVTLGSGGNFIGNIATVSEVTKVNTIGTVLPDSYFFSANPRLNITTS